MNSNNRSIQPVTQHGAVRLESFVSVGSCLVALIGVLKAVHSEQPLFWLLAWPLPVAFASTIFIFIRQGFHFEAGLLVLGRPRD